MTQKKTHTHCTVPYILFIGGILHGEQSTTQSSSKSAQCLFHVDDGYILKERRLHIYQKTDFRIRVGSTKYSCTVFLYEHSTIALAKKTLRGRLVNTTFR